MTPNEPQPEPQPAPDDDDEGGSEDGAQSHDTAGQFPADEVAGD